MALSSAGSEFRPVETLELLLVKHPNWPHLKQILISSSSWNLEDLDEEKRLSDLQEAIARGNHKGAKEKPANLRKLGKNDVDYYGFALPIPRDKIMIIPDISLAPVNIAPQNTIDKHGNIIAKDRLTHDQSFEFGSGTSIKNQRRIPPPMHLWPSFSTPHLGCMVRKGTIKSIIKLSPPD